jgi:hypothetical protein
MLQMLPMLSKEKSNAFVNNEKFSCPMKVFDAMNDNNLSAEEKINSLHTCFGKTKSGTTRQEKQLSKHIYRLMTTTDPEASVAEDLEGNR